jgi:GTP-binding protein EngB required for normal cell division
MSSRPLSWDQLKEYVVEIADKWIVVGIKLLDGANHTDLIRRVLEESGEGKSNEEKIQRCSNVLKEWTELPGSDCSWENLCSVLRHERIGLDSTATKIEQKFVVGNPCQTSLDQVEEIDTSHPLYQKIHGRLKLLADNEHGDIWNDENEWNSKVQRVLEDLFKEFQGSNVDVDDIGKWIEELYEIKHCIPPSVYSWAKGRTLEIKQASLDKSISEEPLSEFDEAEVPNPVRSPIFSKENQYHALLCCKILQHMLSGDVATTLKEHGHAFDHYSFSRSECRSKHGDDKDFSHGMYLIAQKEDTYIVAFRGLQDIGDWKKYDSLQDALIRQAGCVPCNYFTHLVEGNKRVIFTGFSLGGILACAVLTRMLQSNPLQEQLLKENVACITFGQPPFLDSSFHTLLTQQPFLSDCFHYVYSDNCPTPVLLKYCLVSLDGQGKQSKAGGSMPVASINSDILLDTRELLKESASEDTNKKRSLHVVKDKVNMMNKKGIVKEADPPLPRGTYYLLKDLSKEPLVVNLESLPREKALTMLSCLDPSVAVFTRDTLLKHDILHYYQLFMGFWKLAPEYTIPSLQNRPLPCIGRVSPVVKQVEFHIYEHEVCILVSGTDLWFSRDLSFPKIKTKTTLALHTQTLENADRLIQVRSKNKKKILHILQLYKQERVEEIRISLGACLDVVRHSAIVTFAVKDFEMSMRQAQLANLSDRQLIGIALLSATLEKRSYLTSIPGQKATYSKKYESIRSFLKKASSIVPIEGCLYTLAEIIKLLRTQHPYAIGYLRPKIFELLLKFSHCARGNLPSSKFMLDILDDILYDPWNRLPFVVAQMVDPEDEEKWMKIEMFLEQQRAEINMAHKKGKKAQPIVSDVNMHEVLSSSEELDPQKQLDAMKKDLDDLVEMSRSGMPTSDDLTSWDVNEKLVQIVTDVGRFSYFLGIVLDSFMSVQVRIPLSQTPQYTARALDTTGVAVGVWYLIGLSFVDMKKIVQDHKLVIDVADYLGKYYGFDDLPTKNYVGKLNFICNAMSQRVSCSTQYISYSLERQLSKLCAECGITSSTTTDEICDRWDEFFKEKILSLIPSPYHPLIARWIRWTLAVFELRETLASYTTIGIIGLMNSGKTSLVNSLFGQKIPSGTMEAKRTTVPFLYSLEPEVEGIDVIDFPGVDDCNIHIQSHCKTLFQLPQIIIFLVDYRKAHSNASMAWLKAVVEKGVPCLVCLTFGDKLFAECMPSLRRSNLDANDSAIQDQLQEHKETFETQCSQHLLGGEEQLPFTVEICAFDLDKDSVLNEKENRRRLRNVGIKSTADVGEWIVELLQTRNHSKSAESLRKFFDSRSTSILH